ncbi:hypothetical protein [Bounagaea algeriensis]
MVEESKADQFRSGVIAAVVFVGGALVVLGPLNGVLAGFGVDPVVRVVVALAVLALLIPGLIFVHRRVRARVGQSSSEQA